LIEIEIPQACEVMKMELGTLELQMPNVLKEKEPVVLSHVIKGEVCRHAILNMVFKNIFI